MNAKYKDGKIEISIADLFDGMSPEEKRALATHLACENDILKDVADQLLTGWTDDGSHGYKSGFSSADAPSTPLEKTRREIALRAGDVAKQEIESLVKALKWAKHTEEQYSKCYHALLNLWPDNLPRPSISPSFRYGEFDESKYEVVVKQSDNPAERKEI